MARAEILAKVRALMARAADPGATVEEQRTSAHVAAKLCREHGIAIGDAVSSAAAEAASPVVTRRAEVVVNGVRTVVETISQGRQPLADALGFDVFAMAQDMLQQRLRDAMTAAIAASPPPRAVRVRKRRK